MAHPGRASLACLSSLAAWLALATTAWAEPNSEHDPQTSEPTSERASSSPEPQTESPASLAPATLVVPRYDEWMERLRTKPRPPGCERFLPLIRTAFAHEGVPVELAWIAEIESAFNPRARSPAGARGLFQLMPATAKAQGLRLFPFDERTHPQKCARATARLLRRLHAEFGSWPLALAAYNAGEGRVQHALTTRKATTFAEIADALPPETRQFVPKALATVAIREGVTPADLAAPR